MSPAPDPQFVFDTLRDDLAKLQLTLRDDLAAMKAEITDRLDAINGTVRRHDRELAVLQKAAHDPHGCPLAERVAELDKVHELNKRLGRFAAATIVGAVALAGVVFQAISYFRGN